MFREQDDHICGINVFDYCLSDHHSISLHLEAGKPPTIEKEIVYRKLKSIDRDQLKSDIGNLTLRQKPPEDIDQLAETYNSVLGTIIDKHAPLLKKRVTVRPVSEWFNDLIDYDSITNARSVRRKYEKKWRATRDHASRAMFDAQSRIVDTLGDEAKTAFYTRKIGESAGNQKSLFKIFDKLMNRRADNSLPSHQLSSSLAERFGDFFNGKIEKIHSGLDSIRDKSSVNVGLQCLALDTE